MWHFMRIEYDSFNELETLRITGRGPFREYMLCINTYVDNVRRHKVAKCQAYILRT